LADYVIVAIVIGYWWLSYSIASCYYCIVIGCWLLLAIVVAVDVAAVDDCCYCCYWLLWLLCDYCYLCVWLLLAGCY
jgi:hypothetical protein